MEWISRCQVHELYERVSEVLRLAGDAVPLRSGMAVERQLAIAAEGSTLEPSEIAAVSSALEGLFELREFFCGVEADAKVGRGNRRRGGGLGSGGQDICSFECAGLFWSQHIPTSCRHRFEVGW